MAGRRCRRHDRILFSSKFVILEVVDIVFGEHVELGGFFEVIVIVIALIATQRGAVAIWTALGAPDEDQPAELIHD